MEYPEYIYLQVEDDEGNRIDASTGEITWCRDRINYSDVEYVKAESLQHIITALAIFRDVFVALSAVELSGISREILSAAGKDLRKLPVSQSEILDI